MEIRSLTMTEAERVYAQQMTADFPADELKPFAIIRDLTERGLYHCMGVFEGGQMLCYAMLSQPEPGTSPYLLLDYFAVSQEMRGKGIGTAGMKLLASAFPDADTVIIEAEEPDCAENAADWQTRMRRFDFYRRCGCLISEQRADVFGVLFRILQLPVRRAYAPDELLRAYDRIYRCMLPAYFDGNIFYRDGIEPENVCLIPAKTEDAARIHAMKYAAFLPLYERYQDHDTNPAAEPPEKVLLQLSAPCTDWYFIRSGRVTAGAVRVVRKGGGIYRISPLMILPAYQHRGLARSAMNALLAQYPDAAVWQLSAIKQELRTCYFYEQCGFVRTGRETVIQENLTVIDYEKHRNP